MWNGLSSAVATVKHAKHEFHLFPTGSRQAGLKVADCFTSQIAQLALNAFYITHNPGVPH